MFTWVLIVLQCVSTMAGPSIQMAAKALADPIVPTSRLWPPQEPIAPYSKTMPMRDGTLLRIMAWESSTLNASARKSTLIIRTPYDQGSAQTEEAAMAYAISYPDFMVVTQDLRGTHYSAGQDQVFGTDWEDGYDTLLNLANTPPSGQPSWWWNGLAGTWGASALAINQYCFAGENISSLRAQMLGFGSPEQYDQVMFQGGTFRENMLMAWSKAQGAQEYVVNSILTHPKRDDFWIKRSLDIGNRYSQVHAAGLHEGGWDCPFADGTLAGYVGYSTRGSLEIQNKQLLQIAGIGHGALVGEIAWPNATSMPIVDNEQFLFQSELELKYGARGTSGYEAAWQKRMKVQFYVFGDPDSKDPLACRWQLSSEWPPQAKPIVWYLWTNGPNPHQGLLGLSLPITSMKATFQYDPTNPCPTNGGNNLFDVSYIDGSKIGQGSCDQRGGGPSGAPTISNRSDVLSFWSPPLVSPLEFAGMVTARLFVQSNRPDTDFVVKLVDVFPDGRQMLVSDGIVRACRYQGFNTTNWLQPGNTYELRVKVGSKAWRFGINHRVMVLITSSNFPRFQRNVNMAQELIPLQVTHANSAIATNSIIMSSTHPSSIILPIPNYGQSLDHVSTVSMF